MTRLRDALRSRNGALLLEVENLVGRVTPQLWHTWSTFPTGTKHTPEHTKTVEDIASLLISDEVLAALHDDEIAMLILACHFHDLGMAGTEIDNSSAEGRDRIRTDHAVSVGERIRQRWQELGFNNETYATVLGEICRGHRPTKNDGVATWDNLQEHMLVGPNRYVRLRLISAMVYAADELHLGDDRASRREEEWKQIVSSESLKHWRRHQLITGPARPTTTIVFDVRITAFAAEADVRRSLRKALLAVSDLQKQLRIANITSALPTIQLQWIRDGLWKLLIVHTCSDGTPRTRIQIRDQVISEFRSRLVKFELLDGLCKESPATDDEIGRQVDRAIGDFLASNYLAPSSDPTSFCLLSDKRTAEHVLSIARAADEIERLFGRSLDANHESHFLGSEVGKQYIRDVVFPQIRASYGVDIATMPASGALRTAIQSSPTTCRLLQTIAIPPGSLSKHDLLHVGVCAGICFDLVNNPELLLQRDLRHAIRELFEAAAIRLPKFLKFLQHLALVKDLSIAQVTEILIPSALERDALSTNQVGEIPFSISQTIPAERPDWTFAYLLLAGQRANEPIKILNCADAPLTVSGGPSDFESANVEHGAPLSIEVQPGTPTIAPTVSVRATVRFEASERRLIFTCYKLTPGLQDELPVLLTLPSRPPEGMATSKFSFRVSALTVSALLGLIRAEQSMQDGDLEFQIVFPDVGVLSKSRHRTETLFNVRDLVQEDVLIALAELNGELFLPLVAKEGALQRLVELDATGRAEALESLRREVLAVKPSLTSVTIRFSSSEGKDYLEKHLGSLPIGIHFSAPMIESSTFTQDQFNERVAAGTDDWKISFLCREDCFTLADELEQWFKNPESPFPFKLDNQEPFHFCKTRVELEHFKYVDRFWYIERPVVFRFCSTTKLEQYEVELKYWRSIGDSQREELLGELIADEEKLQKRDLKPTDNQQM